MEKGSCQGGVRDAERWLSITVLLSASLVRNERSRAHVHDALVRGHQLDRKRMEEELRIKDSAIRSSIDGIGLTDLQGNIIYVNDAHWRWGAEDASEFIGKSALTLAQSEEAMAILQSVMEKEAGQGGVWTRKDGPHHRPPVGEPGPQRAGRASLLHLFVDITERRWRRTFGIESAIASSIDGIGISDSSRAGSPT